MLFPEESYKLKHSHIHPLGFLNTQGLIGFDTQSQIILSQLYGQIKCLLGIGYLYFLGLAKDGLKEAWHLKGTNFIGWLKCLSLV